MDQEIRFCAVEEGNVAYALAGRGPALVVPAWWVSHLELDWADERFRAFFGALAESHTVVRYDRPGVGLSDRDVDPAALSVDRDVVHVDAVLDAAGIERAAVLGVSSGACAAAAYAARRPERVERLVLYGSYGRGEEVAPPEVRASLPDMIRTHWGMGARLLTDVLMPGAGPAEREAFAGFQRAAAAPSLAAALLEYVYAADVADALPRIAAPTIVLHRRDDAAIPYPLGRDVAARIPGARFLPLEGRMHLPWQGDAAAVARAVAAFLDAPEPSLASAGESGGDGEDAATGGPAGELTRREAEILSLVAEGLSDAQIAERLVVSPHTVHRHIANIRTKLRQPSRAAAVAHATRHNLI